MFATAAVTHRRRSTGAILLAMVLTISPWFPVAVRGHSIAAQLNDDATRQRVSRLLAPGCARTPNREPFVTYVLKLSEICDKCGEYGVGLPKLCRQNCFQSDTFRHCMGRLGFDSMYEIRRMAAHLAQY